MTVKEKRAIETNELQGYIVNSNMYVPLDTNNSHYREIQEWIAQGNTPEPAYTETELVAHARTKAVSRVNQGFENDTKVISSAYPELEKLTWDSQEREARDWFVDNTVATPLLDSILLTRTNLDKATLVDRIITKADSYKSSIGNLIGKRQLLEDTITDLDNSGIATQGDYDAIVW